MAIFQNDVQRGRIVASVAATAIALASGTNYVYSAWAPQFAEKLHLSSTQSNLVGLFGNLGMYSIGYPIGLLVDGRGPRPAVLLGAVTLLIGYFPLHQAYDAGAGSVPLLCLFSYLSGVGGCTAFAAAVKTSALNWPQSRGTATAFPLAAFGLSAFFFSLLGSIIAPGDPSAFLLLLAVGTSCICLVAFFFINVYPDTHNYQAVPSAGPSAPTLQMRRPSSPEEDHARRHIVKRPDGTMEPGTSASTEPQDPLLNTTTTTTTTEQEHGHHHHCESAVVTTADSSFVHHESGRPGIVVLAADNLPVFSVADESTPLLLSDASDPEDAISTHSSRPSRTPSSSSLYLPINTPVSHPGHGTSSHSVPARHRSRSSRTSSGRRRRRSSNIDRERALHIDIRGLELLRNQGFWLLWVIMAILAGIGLMTINNIGNNAKALWTAWDPTKDEAFLVNRQQMHVSTLSILSFTGRLLSGVGSDVLVTRLHSSRAWCLAVSSCFFLLAQSLALIITSPHLLILVSALSGLAYGSLFGVFPSIIAETFGVRGLSQNWGFMTMAPVVSGNVFNLFYGRTYDRHSHVGESRERVCSDGLDCYKGAYWVTFVAGWFGLAMVLWTIQWQHRQALRERNKGDAED